MKYKFIATGCMHQYADLEIKATSREEAMEKAKKLLRTGSIDNWKDGCWEDGEVIPKL